MAPPPLKKRHLYIWGPSNYGKSWPFQQIDPLLRYNANSTDYQMYNGQQFIMIEEYKNNIPHYIINQWCDGLPIRNLQAVRHQD